MTKSNTLPNRPTVDLAELDASHAKMIAGLLQVAISAVEERRVIQELRKELEERHLHNAALAMRWRTLATS